MVTKHTDWELTYKFKLPAIGKDRLLESAEYMSKQKPEHFDMGFWFTHSNDGHDHDLEKGQLVSKKEMNLCGTKACAMGHIAVSPLGKRLGLRLIYDGDIGNVEMKDTNDIDEIAEKIFKLDILEAHYLFYSMEAETPQDWAKAVREFVKKGLPRSEVEDRGNIRA